jgi:hypothetical protein
MIRTDNILLVPKKRGIGSVSSKYKTEVNALGSQQFGQLEVFEFNFKDRVVDQSFRFNRERGVSDRIFWKDVFGIKGKASAVQIDGGE